MTDDLPMKAIAENVQRLRKGQSLSLATLAKKSGVGKSTIFNLERAQGNPAIDTLWSLARALEVPVAALFVDTSLLNIRVMRRHEAPVLVDQGTHSRLVDGDYRHHADTGVTTFTSRHLVSTNNGRQCELYWIEMAAGAIHESAGHTAGLIEHVIPTTGSIMISVDNETITLDPGDRMTFPAERPHSYLTTTEPVELMSLLEYV